MRQGREHGDMNEAVVEMREKREEGQKEKTPEEKRIEDVEKMTLRAHKFVAEKKQSSELKRLREETDRFDQAEGKDSQQEEREIPIEVSVIRKKGVIDRIKDKLIIRKFKKAGISDPQKALGFYEYVRNEVDPEFDIEGSYAIRLIKDSFEVTNDPVAFYDKLKEVCKVGTCISKDDKLSLLMADPEFAEKIDRFKSVMKIFGKNSDEIYQHQISNFCQDKDNFSRVNSQNLQRINELLSLSNDKESISNLPALLDIVEDEDVYKVTREVVKNKRDDDTEYIRYVAERISDIRREGLLKKVLEGIELNLGISSSMLYALGNDEKERTRLEGLDLEKLIEDKNFRQFSDDFSALAGKKFNLSEFENISNHLYAYNKDHALAFFEAFRELGIVTPDEAGNFNIADFENILGRWKNNTTTNKEAFYAFLNHDFLRFAEEIESLSGKKAEGGLEYFSRLAFGYTQHPEMIESLKTDEGKKLYAFFRDRGIDPLNHAEMFEDLSMLETLKELDVFFNINDRQSMGPVLEMHKDQKLLEDLIDLLREGYFESKGGKFDTLNIDLLKRILKNKKNIKLEIFKKDFDFYFNSRMLDFMEENPDKLEALFSLSEGRILDLPFCRNAVNSHLDLFVSKTKEELSEYAGIFSQMERDLSMPIRGKSELVVYLLNAENAWEVFGKIKKVEGIINGANILSDLDNLKYDLIMRGISMPEEEFSERVKEAQKAVEINKETGRFSDIFSKLLAGNKQIEAQNNQFGMSEIPRQYRMVFDEFIGKYKAGDKGQTIINLIAAKEFKNIMESGGEMSPDNILESIKKELLKYKSIIENNSFDEIPSGLQATIGMEYEATDAIRNGFEQNNFVSYKKSIERISGNAKVGQGSDAVHEIATQPTNNPYLMLLEMKLLQDLQYIDFNFRPKEEGGYFGAGTGFHLSLGGEHGIKVGPNSCFLNNLMSMNNWAGVSFENEVSSVKMIRDRGTDSRNVLLLDNVSPSIETKNFSIDRWEPFERTVLSCYNGAIAIQAVERYTKIGSYQDLSELVVNFPGSSDALYRELEKEDMIKEPTEDFTVRELIYKWLRLQADVLKVVDDHNENFFTNETDGYLDEDGKWVDSMDSSGRDNARFFKEGLKNFNKNMPNESCDTLEDFFEKKMIINGEALFGPPDIKNTNAITYIGNLYLTKFSGFSVANNRKKNADPNVLAFLTNTRENGKKNENRRIKDVEKTVFDRGGEIPQGYYYLQGGSERLIIHQTQKLFLKFNQDMADLLVSKKEEELSMAA